MCISNLVKQQKYFYFELRSGIKVVCSKGPHIDKAQFCLLLEAI